MWVGPPFTSFGRCLRPRTGLHHTRRHSNFRQRGGDAVGRGGGRAFVLLPGEGRSIDLGGFQMSVKATNKETDGAFSLLEATEPPDFRTTLHIHHDAAEAFYVLQGEYIIFVDGREFVSPAGSF